MPKPEFRTGRPAVIDGEAPGAPLPAPERRGPGIRPIVWGDDFVYDENTWGLLTMNAGNTCGHSSPDHRWICERTRGHAGFHGWPSLMRMWDAERSYRFAVGSRVRWYRDRNRYVGGARLALDRTLVHDFIVTQAQHDLER